jgi:hypothetical protein
MNFFHPSVCIFGQKKFMYICIILKLQQNQEDPANLCLRLLPLITPIEKLISNIINDKF